MPRTRAFYAVVQYVPDGGRAEGANAGVVLYIPETGRVEVRTSPNLARIKKFFSPAKNELRRIELALESFGNRMRNAQREFGSEEEFARFVAARADAVRMTNPRLVVVADPVKGLDELYAELVGDNGDSALAEVGKGYMLPQRVAEVFGRLEASRKLWKPGKIIVPEFKRTLRIPLAFKNGRVNYVLPQSLAPRHRPERRLEKLGFDGLLLFNHKIDGEDGKLVVLSSDPQASAEAEQTYAKALSEFAVEFWPYSKADEFAAHVEQTAH